MKKHKSGTFGKEGYSKPRREQQYRIQMKEFTVILQISL
jgi:hypothetical protein